MVDFEKGDFLTITHGLFEITLITNKGYAQQVKKIFAPRKIKKTIRGVAGITVRIPIHMIETVGLFYAVSKALNWENINIIEIVSTLTEMTLIIKEEEVPRAFKALKGLIEKGRSKKK